MASTNLFETTTYGRAESIILEKLKSRVARRLGASVLESLSLSSHLDYATNAAEGMMLQLEAEIMAEKVGGETYTARFSYPADWWQMFKHRHLPKWLLKRYPVRWKTYKRNLHVKRYVTYPELNRVMPRDFGPAVLKYTSYEDGDRFAGY